MTQLSNNQIYTTNKQIFTINNQIKQMIILLNPQYQINNSMLLNHITCIEYNLENENVLQLIYICKKIIQNYPNGKIRSSGSKKYKSLYHVYYDCAGNRRDESISIKKEKELILKLSEKRYMEKILAALVKLQKMGNKSLGLKYLMDAYETLPANIREFVTPVISSPSFINILWNKEKWILNSFHEEKRNHETNRGECVRSKSERLIANKLNEFANLDYVNDTRYYVSNRGRYIFPDFVILNILTGKIVILEHVGMGDSDSYSDDFVKKHSDYIASGLVVGVNLFYTFETNRVPLQISTVEITIQQIINATS